MPVLRSLVLSSLLFAVTATPAAASPIEVHVVSARPSADGTRLELTVGALVEGKAPPKTPRADRITAITGTRTAPATAVRSIAQEPRAVTVLIDTGALPPPDGVVHRAVGAFVDARPGTESHQIVSVDHEPHGLEHGWTSDRASLAEHVRAVRVPRRPGSLLFEALGMSLEAITRAPGLPDQRALILVSDGLDTGSSPPWTFDYVRGLAEDGGVPVLSVFVPPLGRGQEASARRALAVLSERSGGRVVDLPPRGGAFPGVDAPSLERALLQAGAVLDGLFVVTLATGSLPAGRVTGELTMLGTTVPFNVPLSSPVIAPEGDSAPAAATAPDGGDVGNDGLVLMGLALLLSAVVAFLVARRTPGPSWEELADADPPPPRPRAPAPPPPPPFDDDPPTDPQAAPPSSLDPPPSPALDAPPALDPVPNATVIAHGGWVGSSVSHRGPRQQNEDFFGSAHHPLRADRALFVVADGMGGHNGGYQASRTAVAATLRAFAASSPDSDPARVLRDLIDAANIEVHGLSDSSPRFAGCGTTLVLLLTEPDAVHHGHVGDSRLYRLRGDRIDQLTEDHSLLRVLVQAGAMSAEEAALDPRGHVLSQAIGSTRNLDIDLAAQIPAAPGDRFLLCSDGLSGVLLPARMTEIAAGRTDPEASQLLVMDALNRGTEDNTTVMLVSRA